MDKTSRGHAFFLFAKVITSIIRTLRDGARTIEFVIIVVVDIWRGPRKDRANKKRHVIDQNISYYNNASGNCVYYYYYYYDVNASVTSKRKKIAAAQKPIDA